MGGGEAGQTRSLSSTLAVKCGPENGLCPAACSPGQDSPATGQLSLLGGLAKWG